MNEMQVFKTPEFGNVRAVELDGEPWLVGKDVAMALGYKNPQEAIRTHVDEEDKGVSEILTPGGKQKIPVINESGLYSLVLSSKPPGRLRLQIYNCFGCKGTVATVVCDSKVCYNGTKEAIHLLFYKYRCPKCGKPWKDFQTQCECGYLQKAIGCPKCMNILTPMEISVRKKFLCKQQHICKLKDCNCSVPYIELSISSDEYMDLKRECDKKTVSWDSLNIPWEYYLFLKELWEFPFKKYLYETCFDKNELDRSQHNVVKFFAFLNPESEESKQYFLQEYGEPYEELYRKTHDEGELEKLQELAIKKKEEAALERAARQEALHPTPKCPICGSTRLTKISTLTKAAKISAFGIYGAGDVGKTYKCNNCGVKF